LQFRRCNAKKLPGPSSAPENEMAILGNHRLAEAYRISEAYLPMAERSRCVPLTGGHQKKLR
jgi:hypothetical protein